MDKHVWAVGKKKWWTKTKEKWSVEINEHKKQEISYTVVIFIKKWNASQTKNQNEKKGSKRKQDALSLTFFSSVFFNSFFSTYLFCILSWYKFEWRKCIPFYFFDFYKKNSPVKCVWHWYRHTGYTCVPTVGTKQGKWRIMRQRYC